MATAMMLGDEFELPSYFTVEQVQAVQSLSENITTGTDDRPLYTAATQSYPVVGASDYFANQRFSGFNGHGYSIAILDTGADLDHPSFGSRIVYQEDFADNDLNANDVSGHGTNVAGIAAGLATGANLIILKVFPDVGAGSLTYVQEALQWLVTNWQTHNVVAVNMSISDGQNYAFDQNSIISDELATLAALNITSIVSAGNHFATHSSAAGVSYPAADASVISVGATLDGNAGGPFTLNGATDITTNVDRVAAFSQRHAGMLDVVAPGANITSAGLNGGTSTYRGTSQAAPHVVAAVALAQHMKQQLQGGARLTTAELLDLFQDTGVTVNDGDDENDNVWNTNLNFQRLNVEAAAYRVFEPGAPDLTAASDSGPTTLPGYNTDNYTNVRRPTFTGTAPVGSHVWLYRTGVTAPIANVAASAVNGTYSIQVPTDLADGTYQFWLRVAENSTVIEGNKSAESDRLTVTIDTAGPQSDILDLADRTSTLSPPQFGSRMKQCRWKVLRSAI